MSRGSKRTAGVQGLIASLLVLSLCALGGQGGVCAMPDTFAVHPENPRCFVYRGEPLVLITSTEHYGAVVNTEFDYVTYLDELAKNKLNLSRTFTFYRELENSIRPLGYANPLAPRPGKEILPWLRTGPGRARDGGLKFDLSKWNPEYFARFKDFVGEAARRGIIVEVTLFCNPYRTNERWTWFPCYKENNINGVGGAISEFWQFMEEHDPTVFEFQKQFVRKMVLELNEFDNIYFEICNEPRGRGPSDAAAAQRRAKWQLDLCQVIRDTEARLPKKHLIAVNAHDIIRAYEEGGKTYITCGDTFYFADPRVDIINYHYISARLPARGYALLYGGGPTSWVGNVWHFFSSRRDVAKPIVFDENFAGVVRGHPERWAINRIEAWETIVSGGAGFDNLDWSFTTHDPTGSGKEAIGDGRRLDGRALRRQLGVLARLWRECGPEKMRPNFDLPAKAPRHCEALVASRSDGSLYVVYLADTRRSEEGFGRPLRGKLSLGPGLARGRYDVLLLDPKTGERQKLTTVFSTEGRVELALPQFTEDCALLLYARERGG